MTERLDQFRSWLIMTSYHDLQMKVKKRKFVQQPREPCVQQAADYRAIIKTVKMQYAMSISFGTLASYVTS